ncbi:MAG: hypothetical protein Q4A97_05360 [Comamonadaceae bacterium]|nr:hypothetical protein [Comamonadaceae bacterium]
MRPPSCPLPQHRALRRLAAVAGMAAALAWLSACGDGYSVEGGLVWRPRPGNDDASMTVTVTKSQLDTWRQQQPLHSQQQTLAHLSPQAQQALARLRLNAPGQCEAGATVYELRLADASGTQRYRSANWACGPDAEQGLNGYIATEDLQRLSELLTATPQIGNHP